MQKILVTGAAGFIGFHLAKRLCEDGRQVLGLDNMNDYYDVALKQARLDLLQEFESFQFEQLDIEDAAAVNAQFETFKPDVVINLAAQAGVRYSIENPQAFVASNIMGFVNILEGCRHHNVKHLVYASSSSVYGANTKVPYTVNDNVDHPVSMYAATKKSNELIAHVYAHLFGLPCTGLRFFTVYGPWYRPDMAMYKFTKALYEGTPLDVYNNGNMRRDFTYIDDIVEGMVRAAEKPAEANPDWSGDQPDPSSSNAPWRVYNIGNHESVELMDMIRILERETGMSAKLNMMPMQDGDVIETYADVADLEKAVGFKPYTPLEKGIQEFVRWYRDYHGLGNGPALEKAG